MALFIAYGRKKEPCFLLAFFLSDSDSVGHCDHTSRLKMIRCRNWATRHSCCCPTT
jgi:hypothetical protein